MNKTTKKPLSKTRKNNRRVQFNMQIGQEGEIVYQAQKTIPVSQPVPLKL